MPPDPGYLHLSQQIYRGSNVYLEMAAIIVSSSHTANNFLPMDWRRCCGVVEFEHGGNYLSIEYME